MLAIPAIDIMDGSCVRLIRGDPSKKTIFGRPLEFAIRWAAEGARRLHIVDLDGAFRGKPCCLDLVAGIAKALPGVEIQLGGGLRTFDQLEAAFAAGIKHVVLGSAAQEPGFLSQAVERWGQSVLLALDLKDGIAAKDGWTNAGRPAASMIRRGLRAGVRTAVVTSITTDGTLSGPDIPVCLGVAASGMEVIVSGGVASLHHLAQLRSAAGRAAPGAFSGVILGRALYDGIFSVTDAIKTLGGNLICQPGE